MTFDCDGEYTVPDNALRYDGGLAGLRGGFLDRSAQLARLPCVGRDEGQVTVELQVHNLARNGAALPTR